jgi:hypothetical protein
MLRAIIHRIAVWLEIARAPTHVRFYWIGEPTEVFAALSLEQALAQFADPEDIEDGRYGEVNGWRKQTLRVERTGKTITACLYELVRDFEQYPQQILSQYD